MPGDLLHKTCCVLRVEDPKAPVDWEYPGQQLDGSFQSYSYQDLRLVNLTGSAGFHGGGTGDGTGREAGGGIQP